MSTVNSTSVSPSMSPNSLGNAPKFGTRVPNRVFVGGISSSTTETELYDLFATYGEVRATKIIADRAGVSKGYGFVTFSTEEEAEGILKEENVMLKDRKLNIAPAIRKQVGLYPLSRYFGSQDMGSDTTGSNSARLTPRATPEWNVASPEPAQVFSNGTVFYHNGTPYMYPGSGVVFATAAGADAACQYSQPAQVSEAYYPIIYSPTLYLPQQQYQYPSPTTAQSQWTGQQMRWAAQVNYGQNPSPHASATSAPHYVYTSNGSSNNNNTAAATSTGTTASGMVPVQQQQQQPKGAAGDSIGITSNGCPSTLAYAPTYAAYAPVHVHHQSAYQQHVMSSPRTQDYTDAPPPIETISTAEPPPSHPHQDSSAGNCDSRAVQLIRHASNHFPRPPPNYYQRGCQNSETNYQPLLPPFEPPPISNHQHHQQQQQQQHHQQQHYHQNNNNNSNNGCNRGYQRRGGQHQQSSYGQSRHNSPQQQQHNNNNNRPRFHYKSMSYNDSLTENKCLLTPPKTPMVGDCNSSVSDTSVADTVKKIEALSI